MTNFVIPAPAITKISIKDSQDFFPVRRIYCIGRNYADHAVEMGFDPKDDPFFFQKNPNKSTYFYLLTPKGFSEKAELTAGFLRRKMAEYEALKKELDLISSKFNQDE